MGVRAVSKSGRAAPLSPPERRAAIISATIPLLREQGVGITTRRIAEAAAVAEGTIFSVFPDKETLIAAAVEAALAPGSTVEALESIDRRLSLESRLEQAVTLLQAHFADIWRLFAVVQPLGHSRMPDRDVAYVNFGPVLESVLEPAAASLRVEPSSAARALLAMVFGCSHPIVFVQPMAPADIVALFLTGVRKKNR